MGLAVQAVPLVDMMLECLQRPEQSAADSALQYLTCLDFVPMADRVRLDSLTLQWIVSVQEIWQSDASHCELLQLSHPTLLDAPYSQSICIRCSTQSQLSGA